MHASIAESAEIEVKRFFSRLHALFCVSRPNEGSQNRFLLIKRLGAGFWADVDHVLGQLAASEIMGRVPVVDWGVGGPYGDGINETFSNFFEKISPVTLGELPQNFYPTYWNSRNINEDLPFSPVSVSTQGYKYADRETHENLISFQKRSIPKRQRRTEFLMHRREAVVVSMCYEEWSRLTRVSSTSSKVFGLGEAEARRSLAKRYLFPNSRVSRQIESSKKALGLVGNYAAIHLRGGDKAFEDSLLHQKNSENIDLAASWLRDNPAGALFVLTDSEKYLMRCKEIFGDAVVHREVARSDDVAVPSFLLPGRSGYVNGIDVIIDTYIAAGAVQFFGNPSSNVAKFVVALR